MNHSTTNQAFNLRSTFTYFTILFFAFSIPLSTTVTEVLSYLILVLWLTDKHIKNKWNTYVSHPLASPLLLFIGFCFVGMFFSVGSFKSSIKSFNASLRLGLIPIVSYFLWEPQLKNVRKYTLYAFELALLITIICTLLKTYWNIPIGQRSYGNDVFKGHIGISYMLAISIFFLWATINQSKNYFKIIIILLILLTLDHLFFLNTGRIGYLTLFLGTCTFAWYKNRFKAIASCICVFSILIPFIYFNSEIFSNRIDELYKEILLILHGKSEASISSSIGTRVEFAINCIKLFLQKPLFGYGTGGIYNAYQDMFSENFKLMTGDPHNQYLRVSLEIGLVGLIVLCWLIRKQWHECSRLEGYDFILARVVFFSFFIGCLFNSWFKSFTESFFYILITAYFIPIRKVDINKSTFLSKNWRYAYEEKIASTLNITSKITK